MQTMITGKCDIRGCQADITPAATQGQFNRNRGMHRRVVHGIKSTRTDYIPVAQRPGHPKYNPQLAREIPIAYHQGTSVQSIHDARKERRKMYQQMYRSKQRGNANNSSPAPSKEVRLVGICPSCHAFIYASGEKL